VIDDDEAELKIPKYLISPNSLLKFAWNCVIFCFVVQTAVIMPVRIAFFDGENAVSDWWVMIDVVSDMAFLIDIVINFISVEED
jgi:hypothetical protein